jgi:DNA-binding transcriptional MerR regulator
VTRVEPTYTIEEAARRTGVSSHTLRYYERIGLLAPVGRASSGHRRYSEDDLGAVAFLTLLRQTGMPIRDMLRFVQLTRAGDGSIGDRVDLLEAHRDALAERLGLLQRHFEAIEHKIKIYRDMLVASAPPHRGRTKGEAR